MIKILLVEDDRILAGHWQQAMEEEGFQVIHEVSVDSAIDVLESTLVDVVVTDIVIESREGQLASSGGLEVISYIALNVEPQPKIIATSGHSSNSTFVDRNFKRMRSLRALRKPVAAEQLIETIYELLKRSPDPISSITAEASAALSVEEQLRRVLESNRAMMELLGATDGVWDWKVGSDEVAYAAGFRKLLGYDGEDTVGFPDVLESLSERVHPNDRDELWGLINRSLLEKIPLVHEFRLQRKTGDYIWVRSRATASFCENGEALRMVGSTHDITAQKEAESEREAAKLLLQQNTEKVRGILDNAQIFLGLLSVDGTVLEVNRTALKAVKVPRESVIGRPFWETPWWTHSRAMQDQLQAAIKQAAQGEVVQFEATHPTPEGNELVVDFSLAPIWSSDEVVYLLPAAQDVTETRQLQRKVQRDAERFNWAMRNGNIGMWDWDVQRNRWSFSDLAKTQLGFPASTVWNSFSDVVDLLHQNDRDQALRAVERMKREPNQPFEASFRLLTAQGEFRWIRSIGRGVFNDQGQVQSVVGVHIDIHDFQEAKEIQRKREASLRNVNRQLTRAKHSAEESEARFRMMADSAPAMISLMNERGQISWVNAQHNEYTGRPIQSFLGINLLEYMHPSDAERLQASYESALANRELYKFECRLPGRDGHYHWFQGQLAPRLGPEGEFAGYVGIATDNHVAHITRNQLEKLNADLVHANQELEQFAYVASHDLKQPLRGIDNLARFVIEDVGESLPDSATRNLGKIRERVERLETLLDDFLAYSRAATSRESLQLVDTSKLSEAVSRVLAGPESYRIENVPPLPVFTTEKTPLETVFRNLIGNAVKHRSSDSGCVRVSATQSGKWVTFRFEDDGPGIAAEFHDRIFRMFHTLKTRDEVDGSGMGLAIVKKIVESQGGRIWLESQPGEGAAFCFTWPVG